MDPTYTDASSISQQLLPNRRSCKFTLGEFEAMVLSDGHMQVPIAPIYTARANATDVRAALIAAALPTDIVHLDVNVLLLRRGSECVLIDTGCGELAFYGENGQLQSSLNAAGVIPSEITDVILTHFHPDHIGGLANFHTGEVVFSNARVHAPAAEIDYWSSENPDWSRQRLAEVEKRYFLTIARRTMELVEDRLIGYPDGKPMLEGIKFVAAPGHTPGHSAILIASGCDRLFHWADTVHTAALQITHPRWSSAIDTDPLIAARTRRTLLARLAANQMLVFSNHLPFPSLGRIGSLPVRYTWEPADDFASIG